MIQCKWCQSDGVVKNGEVQGKPRYSLGKSMRGVLTIIPLIGLLSSSALAEQGGGARQACRDDVRSFCASVKPGGGRIIDCLEEHYKDVSDACYNALQTLSKHRAERGDDRPPPPPDGDHDAPPPPPGDNTNDAPPPPPPEDNNGAAPPGGQ